MNAIAPARIARLFKILLAGLSLLAAANSAASAQSRPQPELKFPARICDVTKFGARGYHATASNIIGFDTDAFQKAIDSCAAAGGGTVLVPRNNYMLGPLFLRSNIRLEITRYATLAAGTDPALFRATDPSLVTTTDTGKRAATTVGFINIRDARNVAITGAGIVDGQGAVWWERQIAVYRGDKRYLSDGQLRQTGQGLAPGERLSRPRLIDAANSRNLLFEGVTFENSPSFHLLLENCDDVTIRHAHILAPLFGYNTDAIDPTDSRDILIEHNVLSTGDDLVAIKSSGFDPAHPDAVSANMTIRDNVIGHGAGIAIGSGASGGVKHILVENNSFDGSMFGVRIKSSRGRGGDVSDIVFRNNRMTNVQTPFAIAAYYAYRPLDPDEAARQAALTGGFTLAWDTYPGESDPAQPYEANKTPDFHDITIDGLTATGAERVGIVIGVPERPITRLTLRNVHIQADKGLLLRNATVDAKSTSFKTADGKPLLFEKNAVFRNGAK